MHTLKCIECYIILYYNQFTIKWLFANCCMHNDQFFLQKNLQTQSNNKFIMGSHVSLQLWSLSLMRLVVFCANNFLGQRGSSKVDKWVIELSYSTSFMLLKDCQSMYALNACRNVIV